MNKIRYFIFLMFFIKINCGLIKNFKNKIIINNKNKILIGGIILIFWVVIDIINGNNKLNFKFTNNDNNNFENKHLKYNFFFKLFFKNRIKELIKKKKKKNIKKN